MSHDTETSPRAAVGAYYRTPDLCRRWGVGPDKIHAFIRDGELEAVNVATKGSRRPQWRVTAEAIRDFEARRSSCGPAQEENLAA